MAGLGPIRALCNVAMPGHVTNLTNVGALPSQVQSGKRHSDHEHAVLGAAVGRNHAEVRLLW